MAKESTFTRVVITIAVVVLIICLTFIGILLWYSKDVDVWPPEISECPDYWDVVGPNICQANKDVGNTGNGSNKACKYMDFSGGQYKGKGGRKARCSWAKDCGVYWDGGTDTHPPIC